MSYSKYNNPDKNKRYYYNYMQENSMQALTAKASKAKKNLHLQFTIYIYKLFNEFCYENRITEYKMFENKFRVIFNSQHLILSKTCLIFTMVFH